MILMCFFFIYIYYIYKLSFLQGIQPVYSNWLTWPVLTAL